MLVCRRTTKYLLLILAMLFVSQTFCQAELLKGKVLVVAGDAQFPPYEFVDEINGSTVYRGFDIDVLTAIALHTGYEIQFRPMAWSDALQALENGEVDAISGMKYDAEREKSYDFSEQYMISSQAVFVLKDMSAINGIDDLVGKKVAVQKNDIAYYRLKSQPIDLVQTINQEEAINLLLSGKVEAVVGNKLTGQYILQKNKNMTNVKIVGGIIDPQRYGIAVKKGNPNLAIFNQGLKAIKANGTYDRLYAKWFGELIDYPAQYYKRNLLLSLFGVVFLVIVAVLFIYLNFILKREVKRRTEEIQKVNDELLKKNEYIKQSNKYKEKMLNSGYSGIVTISKDGKMKFFNDYAQKYLQLQQSSLIGEDYRTTNLKELLKEQNIVASIPNQSTGEAILSNQCLEYNIDVLSGGTDDEERIIHFRDVTEQKRLREEVIKKDKMEALGNLVAGIAHEIRNPLTSIKTFTELIPVKYDNPLFRKQISKFVPQEIERLNGIINDLLTYAHPRQIFRESILLKSLLDSTLVFFADRMAQQGIDFKIQVEDMSTIVVDKQQMKQVMINVILNALQALEQTEKPQLQVIGWQEKGYSLLSVIDNGAGIAKENIDKIFEPFFTTKATGTGLGLFVSYQLVKQNGAEIVFDSTEHVGTTVTLKFPVTSQQVVESNV